MRSGIAVGKRPMGTGIPLGYHEGERVMERLLRDDEVSAYAKWLFVAGIFLKNNQKLWIFPIFI